MNLEVNAKRRSVITTIGLLSTVGLHPSAKGMHRFIDTLTPCFSSCTPVWTLSPSIPGGPYCGPHNVVSIPKIEFYCNVVHWRKFHPAYIHTARHIHTLYIVTTFQHFQWDEPLMWCLYRQFLRASTRLKNENENYVYGYEISIGTLSHVYEKIKTLICDIHNWDTIDLHPREPIYCVFGPESSETHEEFNLSIIKWTYLKVSYSWSAKKRKMYLKYMFLCI